MPEKVIPKPDHTAVRVALWRALHLEVDASPYILEDRVGLDLSAPEEGWRERPDMEPNATCIFRAAIVARARFIEDLVIEQAGRGIQQYVILGAGLDTFAQRESETASHLQIFEVDQPSAQAWKRQRLIESGYDIPSFLHLVPVDFETDSSWLEQLTAAGFDQSKPAVIASTGVTLYLTREAVSATLRQIAGLAAGSTLAMTYILPMEQAAPEELVGRQMAEKGARAAGTPFLSYFSSEEMITMALEAGFKEAHSVSAANLAGRYFSGRSDSLHPGQSEEILMATI